MAIYAVNIVTTYGCVCDGIHDDTANWNSFKSDASSHLASNPGDLVQLTIPAGKIVDAALIPAHPFGGIKNLQVTASGATFKSTNTNWQLGNVGEWSGDSAHTMRISGTANPGDTVLKIKTCPVTNVTGAANNGSGLIRLSLSSSAGFSGGSHIYVHDVAMFGGGYFNGNLTVSSVIDSHTVDLNYSWSATGSYDTGGATGNELANFAVGNWVMIRGIDTQGGGYPSNNAFFEYKKITAIDSVNNTITIDSGLKNTYKDTWPFYSLGGADQGGPGTVQLMDPSWDSDIEYDNCAFNLGFGAGAIFGSNRTVTMKNCSIVNGGGASIAPSAAKLWYFSNCNFADSFSEIDKYIEVLVAENTSWHTPDFQSTSCELGIFSNCTIGNKMEGTPKTLLICNGSVINNLIVGTAYGRGDEVILLDSEIDAITVGGNGDKGPGDAGWNQNTSATLSGGVLTINNAAAGSQTRWAVPNTKMMWVGEWDSEKFWVLNDITQDSANTYYNVSWSGSFPSSATFGDSATGAVYISTHPSPLFTARNCTGAAGVYYSQYSQQIPVNSQLTASYTKSNFNGGFNNSVGDIWGKLIQAQFSVSSPYTGGTAKYMVVNQPTYDDNNNFNRWQPNIDLTVSGTRTITNSSVVGSSGADSGLTTPSATTVYLTSPAQGNSTVDISGASTNVSVSVNITTDHGFSKSTYNRTPLSTYQLQWLAKYMSNADMRSFFNYFQVFSGFQNNLRFIA